jgi:hypothetical protein
VQLVHAAGHADVAGLKRAFGLRFAECVPRSAYVRPFGPGWIKSAAARLTIACLYGEALYEDSRSIPPSFCPCLRAGPLGVNGLRRRTSAAGAI